MFLRKVKSGELKSVPDRVAVLGGGNTAMDAAVTARRLGATDVYLVYRRSFAEMPVWPAERAMFMASGGHCLILTQPLGYETDKDGNLTGLKVMRTELGEADASGRRRPVAVPNSESVIRVGLAIEAIGQDVGDEMKAALKGLAFTRGGLVQTRPDNPFATSLDKVFAAGDLVNGGATAVQGVAEGMKAAEAIRRELE
jgi:NADPH-dependent glutamate synthase beta subunit-like oxidoreductase